VVNLYSHVKLGRLPRRYDPRTLRMKTFISPGALAAVPHAWGWSPKVASWPMLGNDLLGDCTLAGILHLRQLWRAAVGRAYTPTTAEAIALYEALGYNPADPSTDTGEVELDVLKYCKKVGFSDGTKLGNFAELDVHNIEHLKYSIWQLGGAYLGVSLPITAQGQKIWEVVPDAPNGTSLRGSWGEHCVIAIDYDEQGILVVSWGQTIFVTWNWWKTYTEESWGITSIDFMDARGVSPLGLNLEALEAAALEIAA
jgi:hypothetical protein